MAKPGQLSGRRVQLFRSGRDLPIHLLHAEARAPKPVQLILEVALCLEDLRESGAVLPHQPEEQVLPLSGLIQTGRIVLVLLSVGQHLLAQLHDREIDLFHDVPPRNQGRIQSAQLLQRLAEAGQLLGDGALAAVQTIVHPQGVPGQLLRVLQATHLVRETIVLPGLEVGCGDFVELMLQERALALQPLESLLQHVSLLAELEDAHVEEVYLLGQLRSPGEGVQDPALLRSPQESLVLVLSVKIHQSGAELPDDRRRGGGAVDPCPVPSLRGNLPLEDEEAVGDIHSQLAHPLGNLG